MNQNEIKRLKEIVIYKGLGFFKEDMPMINNLEKMGFITIDNRQFARPTQKGINKLFEMGVLK
jgi:hypothetical protein